MEKRASVTDTCNHANFVNYYITPMVLIDIDIPTLHYHQSHNQYGCCVIRIEEHWASCSCTE